MQLPATATIEQAAALVKTVEEAVSQLPPGSRLTVDAAGLAAFDTSLVAVLLHARRLAQHAGRAFEVTGAPEKLFKLARLYGVEELLSLVPDSASARSATDA
jgi:phospholipid transport system transporter-binding protein